LDIADIHPLSLIIFLPLAGAILIALLSQPEARTIKRIAAAFTLASFAISLALFCLFDQSDPGIQFQEKYSWISQINVHYFLGVDGLSLPLVVLTTLLGFLVVLVSWKIELRTKEYFAWLLVLETSILGVFCSLDLLLFFLFWEIEVIPMYFLISIWGHGRKDYSAMKYVIYTIFGSAMMLAGILLLYFKASPEMAAGQSAFDMIALRDAANLGVLTQSSPELPRILLQLLSFLQ